MPPATTSPAPITTPAPATTPASTAAPVNTSLFAQPGENFSQYEARVAGGNSGNVPASPATPPSTTTPSSASTGTSPEDQVAQSLGYKSYADAISQLTAAPTESETDLYNQAYSAAGLAQLQATITGRQNDLADAQNNINDNPWLDEADRVGRNKTVTDLANADIKNYQDEYNASLKEVEDLLTRETADNTAGTAANKAKLAALEAQAKQAATDAANAQKTATAAPKTVKSASGATYQWNPTTQSFDQIFAGKAASTTATTKEAISSMDSEIQAKINSTNADGTPYSKDGYMSPADWDTALNAWNAQGLSTASFISNFKKYANTADPTNNYTGLTKPK